MKKLSQKELSTNAITMEHIHNVGVFITMMVNELLKRSIEHDKTKLERPEVEIFAEYTPKLAKTEYNSEEYKQFLEEMKPALDHHYAKNRHHPEHFPKGIEDMNLVDIFEMLCDWKAATMRHDTGNILNSISANTERFGISKQLAKVLQNTVEYFDMAK